jgi:hypothetical protein
MRRRGRGRVLPLKRLKIRFGRWGAMGRRRGGRGKRRGGEGKRQVGWVRTERRGRGRGRGRGVPWRCCVPLVLHLT